MIGQVHNVNMAVADTEYSFSVPANTKHLLIKARAATTVLKLSYSPSTSGTVYITIPANGTKTMVGSDVQTMSEVVLYFQSTTPDIVEIETWQ